MSTIGINRTWSTNLSSTNQVGQRILVPFVEVRIFTREREICSIIHNHSSSYSSDWTCYMRKADLERALKKTTGAALKEVVVKVGDTYWKIDSVRYDPETDRVVITVE